jgi:spore coat protein CotH
VSPSIRPVIATTIALVLLSAWSAAAQTVDELFDAGTLNDVRLMLHSSDWQKLKDNFQDNTYYPADLTWRGVTVRNVGIRSRGLGSRSPIKPGLRVDFDKYSSGQRFLDLKSLVLDNLTQDASMMKEVLSMQLFARLGLPAPREAFVRLFVNNTLVGLYAVVESIDKKFLQRVFGEDGGNLYEYDYTYDYNFEYLGSDLGRYQELFDPKTNESSSPSDLFGPIEEMVRTANEASDAMFESAMAQHLDLGLFARHAAVENFLAENDGWLGYAGMNNFYLYRFKNRPQFQVITWDKDNTFLQPEFPIFERVERNVLMRRAMTLPAVKQAYLDALTAAADSALDGQQGDDASTGWLGRTIESLYALIAAASREDTNKPFSDAEVEAAVAGLRNFATTRAAFVRCAVATC